MNPLKNKTMTEQELLKIKKEIESIKISLTEVKTEEKILLKQIKEEFGNDSVEALKIELTKIKNHIEIIEKEIEEISQELEELC